MKTLYLHIGWRKTGTSAIQSFLTHTMVDDKLGDIAVPPFGIQKQRLVTGDNPIAHHGLANFKHKKAWAQNWDKTIDWVNQSQSERFLITSELFTSHITRTPKLATALAERLAAFDRVIVLCWLRRQDHYMASMRVQVVKHGGDETEESDSVGSFPPGINYFKFLTKLREALPKAEIRPYLFSKSNDLIADFKAAIDLDPSFGAGYAPQRINSSVSTEMYKYQASINKLAAAREHKQPPLQAILVRAWDSLAEDFRKNSAMPLTRSERVIALERYAQANIKLCKKYGLDLPYFQPTDAELDAEPPYNIPEKTSDEFRSAITAAVYGVREDVNADDYAKLIQLMEQEANLAAETA